MAEPISLNVDDACAALGIGKTLLYRLIADGHLDARKIAGRTVIVAVSLRRYVETLPTADIRTGRKEVA